MNTSTTPATERLTLMPSKRDTYDGSMAHKINANPVGIVAAARAPFSSTSNRGLGDERDRLIHMDKKHRIKQTTASWLLYLKNKSITLSPPAASAYSKASGDWQPTRLLHLQSH
jgi:hypothetical protein